MPGTVHQSKNNCKLEYVSVKGFALLSSSENIKNEMLRIFEKFQRLNISDLKKLTSYHSI